MEELLELYNGEWDVKVKSKMEFKKRCMLWEDGY
jgi:hypothetical protein